MRDEDGRRRGWRRCWATKAGAVRRRLAGTLMLRLRAPRGLATRNELGMGKGQNGVASTRPPPFWGTHFQRWMGGGAGDVHDEIKEDARSKFGNFGRVFVGNRVVLLPGRRWISVVISTKKADRRKLIYQISKFGAVFGACVLRMRTRKRA